MLHRIKELRGKRLHASDGDIGHVTDVYFDDHTWAVRYLVVNTGSWLAERLVLLAPRALGTLQDDGLRVNLTRAQIEKSPPVDTHKPVSRQYEIEYYQYYGWPIYWEGGPVAAMTGYPVVAPAPVEQLQEEKTPGGHHRRLDHHLQSAQAVHGYQIDAKDGTLGHAADFLVDLHAWEIRDLLVASGTWFGGREMVIPIKHVESLSYEGAKVTVSLTKAAILAAPEFHERKS